MSALDRALTIARTDPLPADAREQINELRDQIHPFEFEWVEEALALAEMEQGDFTDEDEVIGGPDA